MARFWYYLQQSLLTIRSGTTLVCLLIGHSILAQSGFLENRKYLGLNLGLSDYHNKDLMLSPLIYRGSNFYFDLFYQLKKEKTLQTLEISSSVGDVNSNIPYHTQIGVRAHLGYGYSRQITTVETKGIPILIFLGGFIKTYADMSFPDNYDNGAMLVAYSMNLHASALSSFDDRHSLLWDLQVPAISYVVRLPYAGFDEEVQENATKPLKLVTKNGQVVSLGDYFMFNTRLNYFYSLSERWSFLVKYQFFYHRFDEPRKTRSFSNNYSVGLVHKFKNRATKNETP